MSRSFTTNDREFLRTLTIGDAESSTESKRTTALGEDRLALPRKLSNQILIAGNHVEVRDFHMMSTMIRWVDRYQRLRLPFPWRASTTLRGFCGVNGRPSRGILGDAWLGRPCAEKCRRA
jgi:hypothetical protein